MYVKDARSLIASQEQSNICSALNLLDVALALSPRFEMALELKGTPLLHLRRFKEVEDMLQEYIPSLSLKMASDDSSVSSSSSDSNSQTLSRERVNGLSEGVVKPAVMDGPRGVDSHLKAYERAHQMLWDLESEMMNSGDDRVEQRKLFDAFLGSSALWQPQPCKEHLSSSLPVSNQTETNDSLADGDENKKTTMGPPGNSLSLNIDVKPFYVKDAAEGLKRTRSVNGDKKAGELEGKTRRRSGSPEKNDWSEFLPDSKDFEEAIIAAVLGSTTTTETGEDEVGGEVGGFLITKNLIKI